MNCCLPKLYFGMLLTAFDAFGCVVHIVTFGYICLCLMILIVHESLLYIYYKQSYCFHPVFNIYDYCFTFVVPYRKLTAARLNINGFILFSVTCCYSHCIYFECLSWSFLSERSGPYSQPLLTVISIIPKYKGCVKTPRIIQDVVNKTPYHHASI